MFGVPQTYIRQTRDIDLADQEWTPISPDTLWEGLFAQVDYDGQGHIEFVQPSSMAGDT